MKALNRLSNLFILIISGLLFFFLFSPLEIFHSRAFALSIEDEKELGREFIKEIRKHYDLIDDDFSINYLNDLGSYLSSPVKTRHFPFRFFVIKDNSLNAFAAPGGNIFIFAGLIETFDRLDELAAVICHEIGHVSARHLSERLEKSKKIGAAAMAGMLAGILLGGAPGAALAAGSLAASIQAELHYSRIDERQADQLGFLYMRESGLDPSAMIDALAKIERGNWLGTDKAPPYLLTHPKGPERMANLDSLLNNYKGIRKTPEAEHFKKLYPYFQTIIKAKHLDPADAERTFRLDLEKNPHDAIAYLGLGVMYKKQSQYANAIRHLLKAKEISQELSIISINLAEAYLLDGQNDKALSILEAARRLDEENKVLLYFIGLAHEKKEDYIKAVDIYERLVSLPPVKNEIYYHLGVSQGRLDNLSLAHFYFGVYFKNLQEPEKARFHLSKAADLSNNPSLEEKILDMLNKL